MIFHRKVTRCDRKRNTISVIKKSPWTFGGYTDIHSDWQAPRQSQPFQNSTVGLSNVFWILLWIPGLKLWVICLITFDFRLSYDQYEKNSEREVLVSLSLLDPFLASSSRHVCHVIEQGVVLVCRYSHNFHICWGSPGTSFWMKMFLHLNVINYYRRDTTSLSYFCLIIITRHPRFKPLDTPTFYK